MDLLKCKFNNEHVEGYTVLAHQEGKTFDMSYHDDNYDTVLKNRLSLADYLHTDLKHMVALGQRHTTNFIEVHLHDGGRGMYSREDAISNYDAMYTRDKNLTLYSFHADCCPVLLYCEDQQLIAAIHSGWKGTVNEIVSKVTKHLILKEHCAPQHIYAYIGPSIEQRNFEAKDDIIHLVKKMSFDTSEFYYKNNHGSYQLDSKGLIQQQLLNLGVYKDHIEVSPYCTMENDDWFFSYRKTHTNNRNISIIRLKQ